MKYSVEFFENEIYKNVSNRLKEIFIKNNFPEFYDFVCNYNGESFLEKLYVFYIGLNKICSCGRKTNFISFKKGFLDYCSTKCSSCNDVVRKKYKETCIRNFGSDNVSKNIKIKEKKEKTFLKKYGKKTYLQTDFVKKVISEKYGVENVFQLESTKNKIFETNMTRYGHGFALNNIDIKQKQISTNFKKYGVGSYSQTSEFRKIMSDYNFKKYKSNFNVDVYEILNKKLNVNEILHKKCGNTFHMQTQLIRKRNESGQEICLVCNPFNISYKEVDLSNFIQNLGFDVKRNYRDKYEIDVFIPELNIGFEYNGLYWHSELHKDKNYHKDKLKYFSKKSIQVITIWEDDWIYKNDIIKSLIYNKLNRTLNKIYARKCEIVIISNSESKKFLDDNHLQGWCISKYRIALKYNNEIVCLLTIGKKDNYFEIIRFCSIINTIIVGGFSKLLNFFLKTINPERLISYVDLSISTGDLYVKNGFLFEKETFPNYYYFSKKEDYRISRFFFTKSKLIKLGFDKDQTKSEIMFNMNYYRIYDCGSAKFIYNKKF